MVIIRQLGKIDVVTLDGEVRCLGLSTYPLVGVDTLFFV